MDLFLYQLHYCAYVSVRCVPSRAFSFSSQLAIPYSADKARQQFIAMSGHANLARQNNFQSFVNRNVHVFYKYDAGTQQFLLDIQFINTQSKLLTTTTCNSHSSLLNITCKLPTTTSIMSDSMVKFEELRSSADFLFVVCKYPRHTLALQASILIARH
jgi:hypothetical protein